MISDWRGSLYSLVLATSLAALYLYATLTAWDRFMFAALLYGDSSLRLVIGAVQEVLLCSAGIVFGVVAAKMRPADRRLQLIVCGSIVFLWLVPYGRIEGVLLPIVPLGALGYLWRLPGKSDGTQGLIIRS
jgi:hypothetical protein